MVKRLLWLLLLASASASTTWNTTDIPHGTAGTAYSATLAATGGTAPYTYTVTGGSITACVTSGTATGLSLSSGGAISGTPKSPCYVDFTVHACDSGAVCADQEFFLGIFASTDTYGGIKSVIGCTNGYAKVQKINGHYVWVSPSCRAFFDTQTQAAGTTWFNSLANSHYPSPDPTFYTNSWQHLVDWGINTMGVFSVTQYQDGTSGNTPFVALMRIYPYAVKLSASYSYCSGANIVLKTFSASSPTWVLGATVLGGIPAYAKAGQLDDFDPEWTNCANTAAAAAYPAGVSTNHYKRGVMFDEIDEYPGKAFVLNGYLDPAYMALVGQNCGSGGTPNAVCGASSPLWTKYALIAGVSGVDFGFGLGKGFLSNKYTNIAGLNAAWGTNYTTFGSAGGWAAGANDNCATATGSTGMLDENGCLTVGVGGHADPFTLTTVINAQARADLEEFDYWYSYQQYHAQVLAVQGQDANNPVMMSASYYGYNGTAPHACGVGPLNNFVLGFRDAIVNASASGMLIGCHDPEISGSGSEAVNKAMYDAMCNLTSPGGVGGNCLPIESWIATSSNPDSRIGGSVSFSDYLTQHLRGIAWAGMVADIVNAQGSNGDFYSPGYQEWALFDNPGEGIAFGFMDNGANPYNGAATTMKAGTDYNSIAQGGEPADYGYNEGQSFLGYVTQANISAQATITGIVSSYQGAVTASGAGKAF